MLFIVKLIKCIVLVYEKLILNKVQVLFNVYCDENLCLGIFLFFVYLNKI